MCVCVCASVCVCVCVCVRMRMRKHGLLRSKRTCVCVPDACHGDAMAFAVQERAHKHALQRVLRADAFALEHKRVNDWDLSDAMATFANQYRQELRSGNLLSLPQRSLLLGKELVHVFCSVVSGFAHVKLQEG